MFLLVDIGTKKVDQIILKNYGKVAFPDFITPIMKQDLKAPSDIEANRQCVKFLKMVPDAFIRIIDNFMQLKKFLNEKYNSSIIATLKNIDKI